jgi:hypothetical protein
MKERWTLEVAGACHMEHVYPPFLRDIAPMEISADMVTGRVLVIGQASAFPEQTLVATPETKFRKLRPEIEALYCCDTTYPSSPENHLEVPCVNTVMFDTLPEPVRGTAYWQLSSSYTFLEKAPEDFFDAMLMFRIVDLGTQIQKSGLVARVAPYLKPGGRFIASGGRFPETIPEGYFDPLETVRAVRLTDFSDGYPFTRHTGIILQKPKR